MGKVVRRSDYGTGAYRRRILLIAGQGEVSGELEDDFHHFRAVLEHDGQRVKRARGEALRVPWTTCPGAVRPIARLEGLPLARSLRAGAAHTPPAAQCTHLFDAALLAVSFASRGQPGRRCWDATVPDRKQGATSATLELDGQRVLQWDLQRWRITGPEPFAGRKLIGGFGRWAEESLEPDLAEAAQVLQRAVYIATGRRNDFEQMERAVDHVDTMGAACHTFGPEQVEQALRVKGSVRDYSLQPDALLRVQPMPIDPGPEAM
ncbi:MAG: DUF2889 domain-containing protein [Myxococcales bacterium]|nr:DUF2889 domain-containing protein [Myxococcales bacterium]